MKIKIHQPLKIHDLGQRTNQEDALWPLQPTTDDQWFVLCDGMGGHARGEVASQTVCEALGEWYSEKAVHPVNKTQIEDALAYAYAQLDAKDGDELHKMGTTLTLLYIGSKGVVAAHMGDSRIYHIRPFASQRGREGTILYQSRDHSLVFDLYQAGEITYEEMLTSPQKNIITRAMQPGEDNRNRMDVIHITDIQPDDWFYLCSDGMLEEMTDKELANLLTSDASDEDKHQQLIAATKYNQDNHTAWLIHIAEVVEEEGDAQLINEEPTARCNAVNILPKLESEEENDDVVIVEDAKKSKSFLQRMKDTVNFIKNKKQ